MKIGDQKSSELLIQKKNSLIVLWNDLKRAIFDVLFVVLDKTANDGQDLTLVGLIYESGIDYYQMIQFSFNATILMVWNGGETLNKISGFLNSLLEINNLMPSLNFNAFLACLYLLIFMIVLVIIDIIYVSYSFNKKKFKFTLPLVLLSQIVPLFVTILFIPIMQFLLNIVTCDSSQQDPSVQVLSLFPDIVCFEGTHLVHVSITLFFTSIFIFISTVVAMTLFQPRMTANTIAARQSSNGQVIFIINKVICQFFFSFTPFQRTQIYILLMFFPALWLFYFYHFQQPYYNKQVGKLFRIFSAYYFWTILMLSLSQVLLLLEFDFKGSMVIWFCGLPFIGLNIAYENKSNIDNLFSSNLKFKTGEELQAHLQYVLLLIHDRKNDQNSNMLLVGYIQKHIQTCVEDDCPIKIKKPKKQQLLSQMDENCLLLIRQVERMYRQGIKKFPSCTKLHISFAFFYMQRLKQNAKAYQQFIMAEKCSPSFVEQFIIYRFKKIIKEKLQENKQQQNDLVQIIRFDNHISLCEQAMLSSAKLHKQFWTQLSEQAPNLQKLNQMGSNIISIVQNVKYNYGEILKINSHSPEIIHNYGVYCIFISQNSAQGKKCLNQSKRAYFEKKSKGDLMLNDQLLQGDQCNASIVVQGTLSSMGKIMSVNQNFIQMTGYLKQEITEKNIDKILPQVMNMFHQQAMVEWLKDNNKKYMKDDSNKYFKNIHKGFLKQKNGFIIPVYYKVNYNVFQQKFYVSFKNQKEFTQNFEFKMYVIADCKGVIRDVSSLAFAYFELNKQNLSSTQCFIDEIGIAFDEDIYSTQGIIIKLKKKGTIQKSQQTEKTIKSKGTLSNQAQPRKAGEQGAFLVRGQKIIMSKANEEQQQQQNDLEANGINNINGKKQIGSIFYIQNIPVQNTPHYEVKLQSLNVFGGEILELYDAVDDMELSNNSDEQQSMLQNNSRASKRSLKSASYGSIYQSPKINEVVHQLMAVKAEQSKVRQFVNYADKIKTYRLYKNQLKRVIDPFGQDSDSFDQADQQNIGNNQYQIQKLKNPLYVQKIKAAINTNIVHDQVTTLKVVFGLFFVILVTLSVVSYIHVRQQFDRLNSYSDTNMNWVKDIEYLNTLMYRSFHINDPPDSPTSALVSAQLARNYSISFDPDITITMRSQGGSINQVRLSSSLTFIQGAFLNYFSNSSLLYSDLENMYYNFYTYVYPALESFQLVIQSQIILSIVLLVLVMIAALVTVLMWIYNVMHIDKKCFDIILWFLDIPPAYVVYLQNNCNTFIKTYVQAKQLVDKGINFHDKNLYLQDYHMIQNQDEEISEDNKARKIMIARYKKKSMLSRCDFMYIQMFWLLFYAIGLSLAFLFVLHDQQQTTVALNPKWGLFTRQFLQSSTISNNLRLIKDNNITKVGEVDLLEFQDKLQARFLNPISSRNQQNQYLQLLTEHVEVNKIYLQSYDQNICENQQISQQLAERCKDLLEGRLEGGMLVIFSYYGNLDRNDYLEIQQSQYTLINRVLVNDFFENWKKLLQTSVKTALNGLTLGLVFFITISFFGFILLWIIYLQSLNHRLNKTTQMLNMIPMKMMPKGRKDIRDFFSWIIREANKNNEKQ